MSDKPCAHKAGSIHEIVLSRPPVSARLAPLQLSPLFASQTSEYRPLQRAVVLSRLTLLILEVLQPRNSKNRVESFTINRHCLIFVQIGAGRQIIILIALIPLQRADFNVVKIAFHYLTVKRLVLGSHQNHVDIWPVRCREIREPQILFAIHALVNSRPSARRVDLPLQFSRVQRFRFSAQRSRRCLIHLLIDEQLLRPEGPPRPRKHWNPDQDDNPLIACQPPSCIRIHRFVSKRKSGSVTCAICPPFRILKTYPASPLHSSHCTARS